MRKSNSILLLGLILGLHSSGSLLSAQVIEPRVSTTDGVTTATINVAVSPSRAWEVLTAYESTGLKMPDIKEVKVLSKKGNLIKLSQAYQAPYTFGLRIDAVLVVKEIPETKIEYQLLKGELIRSLNGKWDLVPTAAGTLVRHQLVIKPELPDILKPIFLELSETNLSQSMTILRDLMLGNPDS